MTIKLSGVALVTWITFQYYGGGEFSVRQDKVTQVIYDTKALPRLVASPDGAVKPIYETGFYVCAEGLPSCQRIEWKKDLKVLKKVIFTAREREVFAR